MLLAGIAVSIVAAATLPAHAIIYGLISNELSKYAAGDITGAFVYQNVCKLCLYSAALCIGCWIFKSLFFGLFIAFGELQAGSAHERIFNHLIQKDIEWYDTRENGIAANLLYKCEITPKQNADCDHHIDVELGTSVKSSLRRRCH